MEPKYPITGLEVFQETGNGPGGGVTDAWLSQSGETASHKKERNQAEVRAA